MGCWEASTDALLNFPGDENSLGFSLKCRSPGPHPHWLSQSLWAGSCGISQGAHGRAWELALFLCSAAPSHLLCAAPSCFSSFSLPLAGVQGAPSASLLSREPGRPDFASSVSQRLADSRCSRCLTNESTTWVRFAAGDFCIHSLGCKKGVLLPPSGVKVNLSVKAPHTSSSSCFC